MSEETYMRLVELGDEVQRAQRRLAESAGNLACAVRLLALLMKYRFQLGPKDHALLLAHLQPDVVDTDEQVRTSSTSPPQVNMYMYSASFTSECQGLLLPA